LLSEDVVEAERITWSAVLDTDGTLRRIWDSSRVFIKKSKVRLTGYCHDKVIGPAVTSSRVQELLQQMNQGINKEDLLHE